ncbi:MAG TPA: phosphotransferase [Gammaproteobacteria bacterium]
MESPRSVRAVLAGVLTDLGVSPDGFRYRALRGGFNNRSYLVAAGERRWVVKFRSQTLGPLLGVAAEAEVMAAAARAGLAPAVVAHEEAAGLLVTEYRAGARSLSTRAARERGNIERMAALLRRLHAVAAPVAPFEVERVAQSYVQAAAAGAEHKIARARRHPAQYGGDWDDGTRLFIERADELLALARRFESAFPAAVLCHNDLAAANILHDGQLVLVDFEYAVLAAPILDLANLAVMNRYSDRERAALLEAYGGEIDADDLRWVARLVALLGWFWAAANERRASEPAVYARIRGDLSAQLEAG